MQWEDGPTDLPQAESGAVRADLRPTSETCGALLSEPLRKPAPRSSEGELLVIF